MKILKYLIISCLLFWGCNSVKSNKDRLNPTIEGTVKVALNTEKGTIVLLLSDKTPLHRDNFIKLVKDKYFDGMLFHRVIQNFGIQSGDPDSKNANPGQALGNSDTGYTIPAEINNELFHQRGALNAARDDNPNRASSGSQFFIVQGKVYNDSTLAIAEKRINQMLARYYYINNPYHKTLHDSLEIAILNKNDSLIENITKTLNKRAENYTNFTPYVIPDEHKEVYKTQGGAAHLDQNYTVFGQVIEGMNVVDSIAAMPVDSLDRPIKDVRIITAKILE